MRKTQFSVRKSIATALVLFVVDAFVLNWGVIAVLTVLVIIFRLLPKSAILKRINESPKIPLTKAVIYGSMAVAVFLANFANNKLAKHRAQNLIVVIEQYHQATGNYPAKLADLVPTYIPKIPLAKITLATNNFWYYNLQGKVALFYVATYPTGRPIYSFNSQSWGYID